MEGIDADGHFTRIEAKVPLAEMYDYSSSLRSITQGRAKFHMEFSDYAAVPMEIQRRLQEEYLAACAIPDMTAAVKAALQGN